MAQEKILIVDDEVNILELLSFNMGVAGYQAVTAATGEDALLACAHEHPDLILLDIMLPGIDGMEVCRRLKAASTTADIPIIMLTAKGDDANKVLGLELGADDYITKPFSTREVIARIKALLRRTVSQNDEAGLVHCGSLSIDMENYAAYRNGQRISLTLKEFDLLKMLVTNINQVLSRDTLLDKVWGHDYNGEIRTVDVHIRHLRQKLGDDAHCIETVRNVGYKFIQPRESAL